MFSSQIQRILAILSSDPPKWPRNVYLDLPQFLNDLISSTPSPLVSTLQMVQALDLVCKSLNPSTANVVLVLKMLDWVKDKWNWDNLNNVLQESFAKLLLVLLMKFNEFTGERVKVCRTEGVTMRDLGKFPVRWRCDAEGVDSEAFLH